MNENQIYKLSSDIEFSKFNEKEYLLYNSKLNKYTKLNQNYYDLLILADGSRSVSKINADFQKSHKIPISDLQIISLFNKLKQHGVFGYDESIKENMKIPNYIKFGFIIFKPELVSKITPFLSFLFRKFFFIFILLISSLIFIYRFYINYNEYTKIEILSILPILFMMTAFSVMFHEFGHATATYFFGAKHGGIGGGFYLYYMPIMYADVTDIWRLEKSKRIIVNGAGVYFELIFCTVLSIIGWAMNNPTIEILAFIILIKSLYNLLPFLRADGYWILSDLFDKPNLSFHAFNSLSVIFTSLFKKVKINIKKEDYIIALYGLVNIFIILSFFYYNILFNYKTILNFPRIIINAFQELLNGKFIISYKEFFEYFSVFIFYFITTRLLISILKNMRNKVNFKKNILL